MNKNWPFVSLKEDSSKELYPRVYPGRVLFGWRVLGSNLFEGSGEELS